MLLGGIERATCPRCGAEASPISIHFHGDHAEVIYRCDCGNHFNTPYEPHPRGDCDELTGRF